MDNETGAGIVERGPMEQKLIDIGEKNTGLILRIGEEMQAFAREQDAEAANLHNAITERDALIIELARMARASGMWNDANDDSTWHFTGCPASGHQEKLAACLPVCTSLREIIAKARGEVT